MLCAIQTLCSRFLPKRASFVLGRPIGNAARANYATQVDPFDEALLTAAQQGERAALEQLLSRVERLVYRFGLRMCRNEDDARDVLQETLLAMARNVGDFRGQSSLATWLYTVARGSCIKQRQRRQGQPRQLDLLPVGSVVGDLDRAIDDAIAELAPDDREVLLLRDAEGLTAPEVAAVLGLDVPAVRGSLHRARLAVRLRVAPLVAPESVVPAPGCPDVAALLSRHLEDELPDDVYAGVEQHLEGCARCRATGDSLRTVLAHCRRSSADGVPPAVQRSVRQALQEFLAR
jgi:RNA polymerase sigma-70 factor (ECF subfamily)